MNKFVMISLYLLLTMTALLLYVLAFFPLSIGGSGLSVKASENLEAYLMLFFFSGLFIAYYFSNRTIVFVLIPILYLAPAVKSSELLPSFNIHFSLSVITVFISYYFTARLKNS